MAANEYDLFSLSILDEENTMSDWITSRERYGEMFWRAHHEGLEAREMANFKFPKKAATTLAEAAPPCRAITHIAEYRLS